MTSRSLRPTRLAAAILLGLPSLASGAPSQDPQQNDTFEVYEATIPDMQAALESGRVTAVELVDAYVARIDAYDKRGPTLNAIIRLNPSARVEAEILDRERAEIGPRGPLHGIPVLLKDNYDTADIPTTGGSVALAGLVPPDDAYQVKRLREAGAIILGKTNLHELAMGITTVSSLGGQTRNPYDLTRNPGGSSGGTGAAIAASFAAIGWGTDTCGSIRNPAAQNNLYGLRPTKGLSSIDGIIPLCHSQDVGGPLARTTMDLAIGLDATIGIDSADPATAILRDNDTPRFVAALDSAALTGARLGVLTQLFGDAREDREAGQLVRATLEQMEELGAEIIDVEIPELDSLLRSTSVITYEFKFDLIDYLAANSNAPVQSMQQILDMGLYHEALDQRFRSRNRVEQRDSDDYRTALARRDSLRSAVLAAFRSNRLDAMAYPTLRRKASIIGEPQRGSTCQLSAATGLPALSMPAGFTDDGIPIGMELLGRPLSDAMLLAYAHSVEQAYQPRRPPPYVPPLVGGRRAPEPTVYSVSHEGAAASIGGSLRLDITTGILTYDIAVSGLPEDSVYAITLAYESEDAGDAIARHLTGPGYPTASGRITLALAHMDALTDGRGYVRVFTAYGELIGEVAPGT